MVILLFMIFFICGVSLVKFCFVFFKWCELWLLRLYLSLFKFMFIIFLVLLISKIWFLNLGLYNDF